MLETRGYLEFVVDVAEKQLSQPSEEHIPKVIDRLAKKALCVTKQWNKLQRKVKYLGGILSVFSKPWQSMPKFELVSGMIRFASRLNWTRIYDYFTGISRDDFLECISATPDTLIHPYLIEFEICLRDMWHHFLSCTHLWAGTNSDPATFASYLPLLSWYHINGVVGGILLIDSFFFTRTCPTLLTAKPLYNYVPNITKLSGNIEASTSMLKNSEWCQNIRTLWVARLIIFSKKIDIPPNTVNDVIQTPAGWTPFT